jgi:hypothetical protein
MSFFNEVRVKYADSSSIDAFDRLRVSSQYTIFDSKQLFDKDPNKIRWDEVINGVGATSTYSTNNAAVSMAVTNNNEYVIRQTKMCFNYQPGKSQLILMTGVMSKQTNVTKRIGYFSSSTVVPYDVTAAEGNGYFFQADGNNVSVNLAKNGTVNSVSQSEWNLDKLDGTGPSTFIADWTKAQIFFIDFEWLGVGRVRFGIVINGILYYIHQFVHSNIVTSVYTSSPNQPLRYEIRSTGGSGSMVHICTSVQSEGGFDPTGISRTHSNGTTGVTCATAGTTYALLGLRLAAATHTTTVVPTNLSIINSSGAGTQSDVRWTLSMNPTVAGTFSYAALPYSICEGAVGTASNTVSNLGIVLAEGYQSGGTTKSGSAVANIDNLLRLGTSIAGVQDTLVVTATPVAANACVELAALNWRELA